MTTAVATEKTKKAPIRSAVGFIIAPIKDITPSITTNAMGAYFKYSFIASCISLSSSLFIQCRSLQGCGLKHFVINRIIRNMIRMQIYKLCLLYKTYKI